MKSLKNMLLFVAVAFAAIVICHLGHAEAATVAPQTPNVQAAAQVALQAGIQAAKQSFLGQVGSNPKAIGDLIMLYMAFNTFMGVVQRTAEKLSGKSPAGAAPTASLASRVLGWISFAARLFGGNL